MEHLSGSAILNWIVGRAETDIIERELQFISTLAFVAKVVFVAPTLEGVSNRHPRGILNTPK